MSSLSIQQLLADARKLSNRLREHDTSADQVISSARGVLREVEALKDFQEDVEHLNTVAHNRPRANLVLGIQQENRHIRQLQHENKELRSALEESQNAVALIMSKYREHTNYLVNTTRLDKNLINRQKIQLLQEKTDQIQEMAGVMKKSIQIDDDSSAKEREMRVRLITENKGLREMLEIARKNGSFENPLLGPKLISSSCQTDETLAISSSVSKNQNNSTSSVPNTSYQNGATKGDTNGLMEPEEVALSNFRPPSSNSSASTSTSSCSPANSVIPSEEFVDNSSAILNGATIFSSEEDDRSDDSDPEITFNTIKRNERIQISPSCDNFSSSSVCSKFGSNGLKFGNNSLKACNIDSTSENTSADNSIKFNGD